MRGVLETRAGGALFRREAWTFVADAKGSTLTSEGSEPTGRGRTFKLSARLSPSGALENVDFQVALAPPPTEVTTLALRVFGGRAYGSVIPPGGIPEKLETATGPGFAVRGFSTALDGMMAGHSDLKVGHARRMVVVALETSSLTPRIRDGMLLCTARARARTPAGEEWCRTFEYRWAESAGSAQSTLVVSRAGVVISGQQVGEPAPLVTQLIELEL